MYLDYLECPQCGKTYAGGQRIQTCECGSPLPVRYDLERVGAAVGRQALAARPASLWRYRELLPVHDNAHIISLGEGMTPLVRKPRLDRRLGFDNLFIKDEDIIPTGTFKARGAAVGGSCAREAGVYTLAMPTNGNAGGTWAANCAVAVTDAAILEAQAAIAAAEGNFVCPEGTATFAAALELRAQGWIQPEEEVVLLNTGTGLKYPQTVNADPPLLAPGDDLPVDG